VTPSSKFVRHAATLDGWAGGGEQPSEGVYLLLHQLNMTLPEQNSAQSHWLNFDEKLSPNGLRCSEEFLNSISQNQGLNNLHEPLQSVK
jgi:hypothetical protein